MVSPAGRSSPSRVPSLFTKKATQLLKELSETLRAIKLKKTQQGHTDDRKIEARADEAVTARATSTSYVPHPDVEAPKTGDRVFKRQHNDGHPNDPYTLQADGKPMGAGSGVMPSKYVGLEELPANHDPLVKEGWPTLNYNNNATYATFVDAKPVVIPPGTKLSRLVDEKNPDAGGFWAYGLPENKTQWRKDYAVKDSWNDDGYYVEHTVGPEGLKAWEGDAAGQRYRKHEGKDFYLSGGKTQLFITPGGVNTSPPKLTNWPEP